MEIPVKKLLVLGLITVGLASCSSNDPAAPTDEELTHLLLNGTWQGACLEAGALSFKVEHIYNNGTGSTSLNEYANGTCIGTPVSTPKDFTYTFGADVTVDGTVAGITEAQEINLVFSDAAFSDEYNIFAIKDLISLYTGVVTGTTPETRPAQLFEPSLLTLVTTK